jgi:GNAT superfamily N-acetyltransferase
MVWTLTDEVEPFAARVLPLLRGQPEVNTLALTTIHALQSGVRYADEPLVLGWYQDGVGPVTGAVIMSPPFELQLAVVPEDTVDELAAALAGYHVPGVNGPDRLAWALAAAWPQPVGAEPRVKVHQRLYRLDALVAPTHPAAGQGRAGREDDLDLCVAWCDAFEVEVHNQPTPLGHRPDMEARLATGRVWIWEDTNATPASMAARSPVVEGVARVGPVYTPPEHRRFGYGAAVTAACTADALAQGAEGVVLFTDLANPTSNAIYQTIGYVPVEDRIIISFTAGAGAGAG